MDDNQVFKENYVPDRASEKLLFRSVLQLNWLDEGRLKSEREFGVTDELGVPGVTGLLGVLWVPGVVGVAGMLGVFGVDRVVGVIGSSSGSS